jgi:hypothetical protein
VRLLSLKKGMRSALRASAVALCCAGSVPAAALDNPYGGGTRLTGPAPAEAPGGPRTAQDKARETLDRFAECEMRLRQASIERAIQLTPWRKVESDALRSLADERCLAAGELAIPPALLRGAFFTALYRERFSNGPPSLPATPIDFSDGSPNASDNDARTAMALRQFGDCVARRDIADAHAFVLSRAGTSQEATAMQGLVPHLRPCVVQGSTWQLNKSVLTATLAEVLYREGVASRSSRSSAH